MQLREIASVSGLDKATALRALKTLTAYGFLERDADGFYSPGPAALRLAAIFRNNSNLVSRLVGPIETIAIETGHAAAFFIRSGDQRVCLIRDRQIRDFRYFVEAGASVSMKSGGAAAHVLEAYTDFDPAQSKQVHVREHGYYVSRGERNPHLLSVALPVFEVDGTFLGAVAITALNPMMSEDDIGLATQKIRKSMASAKLSTEPVPD